MKRILLSSAVAALVLVSVFGGRAEAAPPHHYGGYHGHGHVPHHSQGLSGFGYYGPSFSFGYQGYGSGYGAPFQQRSFHAPIYPQHHHQHHGW